MTHSSSLCGNKSLDFKTTFLLLLVIQQKQHFRAISTFSPGSDISTSQQNVRPKLIATVSQSVHKLVCIVI